MSNLFNTFGSKNTINIGNTAKNALNAVATNTQSVAESIATNAQKVVDSIATNTTAVVNNVFKNIPNLNMISPIGNTFPMKSPSPIQAASPRPSYMSALNNAGPPSSWKPHPALPPVAIFIGVVIVFLVLLYLYSDQINSGWNKIVKYLRELFGMSKKEEVIVYGPAITSPPISPQEERREEHREEHHKGAVERVVESILPAQAGEVFNVETNEYSYYDAEPLCQALGAQLATYDQVKDAWNKGADWCNYGWVKGQVAVYPTQQETFNKLQNGPVEERNACGTVGLNGGYFDNPEMRFGVNCYGRKESQTDKAAAMMSQQGGIPKTTEYLQFDKKVQEFKEDSDSLNVLPWSPEKWSDV
jgi:hypothetical protein